MKADGHLDRTDGSIFPGNAVFDSYDSLPTLAAKATARQIAPRQTKRGSFDSLRFASVAGMTNLEPSLSEYYQTSMDPLKNLDDFAHNWTAEILAARPLILPSRNFVYPAQAEEVERGALEILVRPQRDAQPFLATCALGFRDPAVPSGLWSTPHPDWMCAVAGGYAYLINTGIPEEFVMVPYRPTVQIMTAPLDGLLLFASNCTVQAWNKAGQAWESERLSDEGLTVTGVEDGELRGKGWELQSDEERPFALDMRTGHLLQRGAQRSDQWRGANIAR